MGLASVSIQGNLGRDAELKDHNGDALLTFSVAVSSKRAGEETTSWFSCTVWGARAKGLAPHLTKGTSVALTGGLTCREYTAKTGETRTSLEVRVDQFAFAGSSQEAKQPREQQAAPASSSNDSFDDLPF